MLGARGWWSVALLSTTFSACLFPDYRTAAQSDASSGTSGAAGSGGNAEGGGEGGNAGTDGGNAGTDGSAGTSGTGAEGGSAGSCSAASCPTTEQCSNGADDDSDERIDCFDSDCDDDAACTGRCFDAAELPCDAVRAAKRSDAAGATQRIMAPDYKCVTAENGGPEFAYRFTGGADRQVFVELYGLSSDLDVMLVDVAAGTACDAKNACTAAGSANNDAEAEVLTFNTLAGRDYYLIVDGPAAAAYSISAVCSPPTGCRPLRPIEVGPPIVASNTPGSTPNVTQALSTYDCISGSWGGAEAAFIFTPTEAGQYQAALINPSANVDLFVLKGPVCNGTCLSPLSYSVLGGRQDESVTFMAAANTSYFIVVDGNNPATFSLSITKR